MGRAIVLLVFFIAFVVFAVAKAVGTGVKTAYNAVFNPGTQEAQAAIAAVHAHVGQFLAASQQELPKRREDLAALLGSVDGILRQHGFALERDQIKGLVATAIAAHGVAPDYQVRTLLDFV